MDFGKFELETNRFWTPARLFGSFRRKTMNSDSRDTVATARREKKERFLELKKIPKIKETK